MKRRILAAALGVMFVMLLLSSAQSLPAAAQGTPLDRLNRIQKRLLSGFASYELNPQNLLETQEAAKHVGLQPANAALGQSYMPGVNGCAENLGGNVKVNQNCLNLSDPDLQGRGQAQNETAIAIDPNHPNHLVASYNDYRRGDGTCGVSYSLDNGSRWQDSTVPDGFTRGSAFGGVAREYWQAGGDTAVAWDTKGNAYLQCMLFMRGQPTTNNPDLSSGIFVLRSTQNNGASWNFPARPVAQFSDITGTAGALLDKPYLTVDAQSGSPFQDRVYVSWTLFASDGSAKIYEAHSSDFGETFSAPVLVSGASTLCPNGFTAANTCDENQFSQPFTGTDGALYVVYANFNNAVVGKDNRYQILLSKSTDGGATFAAPIKVADYYDLPDCATYQAGQDAGRACVPEKGTNTNSVFRATNYASGAVNPKDDKQVVVTFGSYINADSKESNGCTPDGFSAFGDNLYTGVKTAGACNNKILVSISNDGGATFTGGTTDPRNLTTANQAAGQAATDQWWQWAAFTKGGKFAVSYYDRQYGSNETSGAMDVSLSGSKDLDHFGVQRVTSRSMPLPTQFTNAQGNSLFFGDYTGLDAVNDAHPVWMDTRDVDLFACKSPLGSPTFCTATETNGLTANDQDVFSASTGVPSK